MPSPTIFDIYLGIGKIIQDFDDTIPMVVKGMDTPGLDQVEDWLQFDVLGEFPRASRVAQINEVIPFQLTCFTKAAYSRKESGPTSFTRHVELASIYKPLLHQQDFIIKNACIRLEECRISFLDLRTSTFTAKAISTGTTPLLQTQSAVILVDARLITNKE
jgi:hypothetical protein